MPKSARSSISVIAVEVWVASAGLISAGSGEMVTLLVTVPVPVVTTGIVIVVVDCAATPAGIMQVKLTWLGSSVGLGLVHAGGTDKFTRLEPVSRSVIATLPETIL